MHLRSKTVQQLLSVILSVVMILSMLPMEVLAQETPPGDHSHGPDRHHGRIPPATAGRGHKAPRP